MHHHHHRDIATRPGTIAGITSHHPHHPHRFHHHLHLERLCHLCYFHCPRKEPPLVHANSSRHDSQLYCDHHHTCHTITIRHAVKKNSSLVWIMSNGHYTSNQFLWHDHHHHDRHHDHCHHDHRHLHGHPDDDGRHPGLSSSILQLGGCLPVTGSGARGRWRQAGVVTIALAHMDLPPLPCRACWKLNSTNILVLFFISNMSSHYFKYQCQEVPPILRLDSHKALLFQIYPKRPIQEKNNFKSASPTQF